MPDLQLLLSWCRSIDFNTIFKFLLHFRQRKNLLVLETEIVRKGLMLAYLTNLPVDINLP